MFEDAIKELDSMGLPYTEGEDGILTIDISSADKTDVVNIVSFLNSNGLDYTISDESIIVQSGMPMEQPAAAEVGAAENEATSDAMSDAFAGMM